MTKPQILIKFAKFLMYYIVAILCLFMRMFIGFADQSETFTNQNEIYTNQNEICTDRNETFTD